MKKILLFLKKVFFSFICSIVSISICFLIFKDSMHKPNLLIFTVFAVFYVLSVAIFNYIYSIFRPDKKEPLEELVHSYLFLFVFLSFFMNISHNLLDFIFNPSTLTLKSFLFFIFYICFFIYIIYEEINFQKKKNKNS